MSEVVLETPVDSNAEEVYLFSEIVRQSLFFPALEKNNWLQYEGLDTLRVALYKNQVIGGMTIQKMGQWFMGSNIPVGAMRAVAIAPEFRGQGLAAKMMTASLRELYEENIPISALYPSTQQVYRKVGYERAGTIMFYEFPCYDIPLCRSNANIVSVDLDDIAVLDAIYTQKAQWGNGNLARNTWGWRRLLDNPHVAKTYAYLIEHNGNNEGYVVFSQVDGGFGKRHLKIHDMVFLTNEAGKALLSFLAGHRSIVQTMLWNSGPGEPLFALMPNQSYQVQKMLHWMLRIVNVQQAIEKRCFPEHTKLKLELCIQDDILPENNGNFVWQIEHGKATVTRGGSGSIKLDIRGLAAIYSNYLSPWELQTIGYISATPQQLLSLAQIFWGPSPWMPDMF